MPLSFQQKQTFKAQPEQVVDDFKFDGGLIKDVHETKLAPNESPNLYNVINDTSKNLLTRNGYTRYSGGYEYPAAGASSDEANTGTSTGTITIDSVDDYVAQTFQVGAGAAIVQVNFYLELETEGSDQYMQAELWSGATGPDAKLADAQTIYVTSNSETMYGFRFRVPYTLASSTEYAVVLKPKIVQKTDQSVNTVYVHHTGDDYANGGAYTSTDGGMTWSAVASTDLKFDIITGGDAGATGLTRFYGQSGINRTIAKFGSTYYMESGFTMEAVTLGNGITPSSEYFNDFTVSNGTLLLVDNSNYILKFRGAFTDPYTTGTLSVTNGSATVTGSGTSWDSSSSVAEDMYIQLPDSKWYKIVSVESNTSLTIEVKYYGSTLSGQSYVVSPWGVVQGRFNNGGSSPSSESVTSLVRPRPAFIENHINRIWTLSGNSLRFSALDLSVSGEHFNDWDTSGNAGQIIIPSGDGDEGTGLYSLGGSLYIFQRRAIWRLYGTSPANFELRNVTNEVGMISKKTLVEWGDVLIFLSDSGLQMFDGVNVRSISEGKVDTLIDSWANKTSAAAVLWDNKYVISYTENSGSSNSMALVCDLHRGTFWLMKDIYAACWSSFAGGTDVGDIYFASSNQGIVYKWDDGSHDDGYDIETLYDTPSLSYGGGINNKSLKRFYVQQLALGDWTMETAMLTDITDATTNGAPISLNPGSAIQWDVFEWDNAFWSGEGAIITTRIAEFQGQGKYFKFRISQTGYAEGIEVLGIISTARLRRLT